MSRYQGKNEEHAFKRIQRDIRDGNLKSPLFFYGEEEYLVKWAMDEVVERFVSASTSQFNCTLYNWDTVTIEEIAEQCETLPMLSEKRIVFVENLKFSKGKEGSGQKAEELIDSKIAELIKYLEDIPETCILVLISDTVDKRRKIYKTINSLGTCYDFCRLQEADLRSFIRKRFKQGGKQVNSSVIRLMIEMSGYFDKQSNYTLYSMDNDIKKLIAYSEGDKINESDLVESLSRNTESYIFHMIDAISQSKKGEALALLHNLLQSGESWQRLLALIYSSYETMLIVKEMIDRGFSLLEIRDKTNIHKYRIEIASRLAGRYSKSQLQRIVSSCFDVDKNIKSGLLDNRLALEMLIAGI